MSDLVSVGPRMGPLKTAVETQFGQRFADLPPCVDVMPLAVSYGIPTAGEHTRLLVDAGKEGRAMRALIQLSAPVSSLSITTVSNFASGVVFRAFTDAKEYVVVDPEEHIIADGSGYIIDDSDDLIPVRTEIDPYVLRRRAEIGRYLKEYYFLSSRRDTDVVLAPYTCNCHFDAQHLDYLRASLDLRREGSMLLVRLKPDKSGHTDILTNEFFSWMSGLGFSATVFLGTDNIYKNFDGEVSCLFKLELEEVLRSPSRVTTPFKGYFSQSEKIYYDMYRLYVVFQREEFPAKAEVSAVFKGAINWERTKIDPRSAQVAEIAFLMGEFKEEPRVLTRKESLGRLDQFEAGVLELVDSFYGTNP